MRYGDSSYVSKIVNTIYWASNILYNFFSEIPNPFHCGASNPKCSSLCDHRCNFRHRHETEIQEA